MSGRVIQGFFLGGQARPLPAPHARAPIPCQPAPQRARAGPPAPASARSGAPIQAHGAGGSFAVDPVQLGLSRGGGSPLPTPLLTKMEAAFGADFSAVRVHVGPQAARIGAIAFTTGNDLYFAPGRYQPDSVQGQQLIGHELAHVIQQRQGRVQTPGSGVAVVQDHALEAEADRLGMRAAMHRAPVQAKAASVRPIQPKTAGSVAVAPPIPRGGGSVKLTANADGRHVGSVMLHSSGTTAALTDLGVDQSYRHRGIGQELLVSAARAGLRAGNSRVSLTADDNGSGKLLRWYKALGFQQTGIDRRGKPELVAPISRLLAAPVQRFVAPRACAAPVPHVPGRVVQRMSLGFEKLKEPTGYGSVLLSATINGIDIGKAWSKKYTFTEDTEHAEDAVVDFVQSLFLYSEYNSAVPGGTDMDALIKIMQSIKDKGLNIVINNLTASPCSTAHGTCKKKNSKGCAEMLISLMKDYKGAKPTMTVNADHYYQPTGVGGGAKESSKKAISDMEKAGIVVNVKNK